MLKKTYNERLKSMKERRTDIDFIIQKSATEKFSYASYLTTAFYAADVDCSGAKAIGLSGGSLKRKIDIVPSNWVNTNEYSKSLNKIHRGVQVLDKYKRVQIKNTPFYHNYLLNEKDNACLFNYKKVVRLLKTLKVDANSEINFSSYDIVDDLSRNRILLETKTFAV